MNRHPIDLLEPVFRWLDWLIAEHGHHIYLVMVWASPFLIAWILRGGFWRRRQRRSIIVLPVSWVPPASPPSQPVRLRCRQSLRQARRRGCLPRTTFSRSRRERNGDPIPS